MWGAVSRFVSKPAVQGVAGWLGQTAFNASQVNRQNKFNAREAGKNRQFQERMRNSQWQSAVEDMRAAGINPALAYGQGGNASPSGSAASGAAAHAATDPASSAYGVKSQRKQLEIMEAQRGLLDAQAAKTRSEANISVYDERMKSAEMGRYFSRDNAGRYRMTPALTEWLRKEHEGRMASSQRQVQELRNLKLTEAELEAIAGVFETVGSGGKAAQLILPLLLAIARGR